MARTVKIDAAKAAEAVKGRTPLKAGNYIAVISDVEDYTYEGVKSKGTPGVTMELKITESPYGEGEGVGNKLKFVRVPVQPEWEVSGSTAFQFYTLFKALGVDFSAGEAELPDNDEMIGEEIGIVVGFPNKPNAKGQFWPEVKNFFDPSEGVKESPNPEPPTAGAGAAKQEDDFAL